MNDRRTRSPFAGVAWHAAERDIIKNEWARKPRRTASAALILAFLYHTVVLWGLTYPLPLRVADVVLRVHRKMRDRIVFRSKLVLGTAACVAAVLYIGAALRHLAFS